MLDKASQPRNTMQVAGSIPIYHRYTLGVAGERFFKAMRDNQQLLASPCPRCADFLLPPKMYCERCFEETSDDWVALEGPGYVRSFTVLHLDLDEEPLQTPLIVAMVSWPEARGGLIHRLGGVRVSAPSAPQRNSPAKRQMTRQCMRTDKSRMVSPDCSQS